MNADAEIKAVIREARGLKRKHEDLGDEIDALRDRVTKLQRGKPAEPPKPAGDPPPDDDEDDDDEDGDE